MLLIFCKKIFYEAITPGNLIFGTLSWKFSWKSWYYQTQFLHNEMKFFLKTIWLKVPEIHFFTYFTTRHLYLSTRVLPYYIKLVQSKMRCSLQICVFEVKFKLFLNFAPYDDFCHVLGQYNKYTKIINWLI